MTVTPTTHHARPVTRDDIDELLAHEGGVCVSLLVPMAATPDASDANRIAFKDAMRQAQDQLEARDVPAGDRESLVGGLADIAEDHGLFRGGSHGLAVMIKPDWQRVYRLTEEPTPSAYVGERFRVAPLIRQARANRRYRVLCVSRHEVALFEGYGPVLTPVTLHDDVPRTMSEAIGGPDRVVTKTKRAAQEPEDSDQKDDQLRRYFHRVAEAIERHHLQDETPVVLAALSEHQPLYREAANHRALVGVGIERDPFRDMDEHTLAQAVDDALNKVEGDTIRQAEEQVGAAEAHGHTRQGFEAVAEAAANGRIDTLYLNRDARPGGDVDPLSGAVSRHETAEGGPDLCDAVASLALRRGGSVVMLPREDMPRDVDALSVLRF